MRMLPLWSGVLALALFPSNALAQIKDRFGRPLDIGASALVDKNGAPIDAVNPLQVTAVLPQITAISRSGLFGTTAAQLMPANPSRRFIQVQVQNSATCYISGISAATADQNSLLLPGGGQLFESSTHVTTGAISIICTAASTPVYAREG